MKYKRNLDLPLGGIGSVGDNGSSRMRTGASIVAAMSNYVIR